MGEYGPEWIFSAALWNQMMTDQGGYHKEFAFHAESKVSERLWTKGQNMTMSSLYLEFSSLFALSHFRLIQWVYMPLSPSNSCEG
jgi:hypothetical protein